MQIPKILKDIADERNHILDKPHYLGKGTNLVVLPISLKKERKQTYYTLGERLDYEIKDSSTVSSIYVKNNEDLPLYISRGQVFEGKTQERVAIHNFIVPPKTGATIHVKCVHQTKPAYGNINMTYNGTFSPRSIDLDGPQGDVWNSVRLYTSNCTTTYNPTGSTYIEGTMTATTGGVTGWVLNSDNNSTLNFNVDSSNPYTEVVDDVDWALNTGTPQLNNDDLVLNLKNMRTQIDNIIKNVPMCKNQVGIVMFDLNKIIGIEYYYHPKNWKSLKDDIIAKEGLDVINDEDDDIFVPSEYREEKVKKSFKNFIKKISSTNIKNVYNGRYRVDKIKIDHLEGEITILNDEILHLSVWEKYNG